MLIVLLILAAVCLCGCGGSGSAGADRAVPERGSAGADRAVSERDSAGADRAVSEKDSAGADLAAPEKGSTISRTALSPGPAGYAAPEMAVSVFHEEQAVGENGVLIDLSSASDGYVAVRATSSSRMKFQVIKDGTTYNYDLRSDGIPAFFPLQMQDGMYSFRVVENISGTKYAVVYSTEQTISIKDDFCPFLYSNEYVKYTGDSACVKKARELSAAAADENGVVSGVYDYICASIKYDREKAKNISTGYMPDPDQTLSEGKGICFDYASLAGAMLRSQGIPCKVIFGYVSPGDLYHAWNMFYTKEDGWVTVKFEISGNKWNRLDLTFSANGADGTFIGDGSNYKEVYCY